jgi:aromatic-amino-acid transaminase
MSSSLFARVEMAPTDPILGVTEAYNNDPNPKKINLGVGVYTDDDGKVPVLQCVRRTEQQMAERAMPRNYLPIDGLKTYDRAVQEVLFGADSEIIKSGRVVTVQTLGGTGGSRSAPTCCAGSIRPRTCGSATRAGKIIARFSNTRVIA